MFALHCLCKKKNLRYNELKNAIDAFGKNSLTRDNKIIPLINLCRFNPKIKLIKFIFEIDSKLPDQCKNDCLLELFLSEEKFDLKVVEYLINVGCNIDRRYIQKSTILHEIIFKKVFTTEKLKMLLKFKPDIINEINASNISPLMMICNYLPKLELIKLFVDSGANPRILDKYGNSCLHYIQFSNSIDNSNITSYLTHQGCNINQKK